MRPFLPSVVLLGAAFLLGCQEQGSGPVGPDTEIGGPNFLHHKEESKTTRPRRRGGSKALPFENPTFTCAAGATSTGEGRSAMSARPGWSSREDPRATTSITNFS